MSLLTPQEREEVAVAHVNANAGLGRYRPGTTEYGLALQLAAMVQLVHRLAETPFDGPEVEF